MEPMADYAKFQNRRRFNVHEPKDNISKKVHLEVFDFYRKVNPSEFLNWIMSIEYYFLYETPKAKKVRFMKANLKKSA